MHFECDFSPFRIQILARSHPHIKHFREDLVALPGKGYSSCKSSTFQSGQCTQCLVFACLDTSGEYLLIMPRQTGKLSTCTSISPGVFYIQCDVHMSNYMYVCPLPNGRTFRPVFLPD